MGAKLRVFTVNEEHGLRVVENRRWRRILRSKRLEVRRGERKLRNEKLHIFLLFP
jgi:hypothetical protein